MQPRRPETKSEGAASPLQAYREGIRRVSTPDLTLHSPLVFTGSPPSVVKAYLKLQGKGAN